MWSRSTSAAGASAPQARQNTGGAGRVVIMTVWARLGGGEVDRVVALYKRGGRFGAISKTNHAVLRFRDPIYRTPRELALSYFHEWFLNEPAKAANRGARPPRR